MISWNSLKNFRHSVLRLMDKAGVLRRINFKVTKKIGHTNFYIPVINGIGYQHLNESEQWITKLYSKILENAEGAFIDVGVNNGQTLLKIASLNKARTYIGFEPNPVCYSYSRNLIEKNKLENFSLYPVGLHTDKKILELFHDNEFASGGSTLKDFRVNKKRYRKVQNIAVMDGDEILLQKKFDSICLIKIDVEGGELEVVRGLTQTILKHQPYILLEILPVYSLEKENGIYRKQRQDELLATLFSMNYKMLLINETDLSLTPLNKIDVHGDMGKTNYLFAPGINENKVLELFAK